MIKNRGTDIKSNNGLKEIRGPWIKKREGLTKSIKSKLNFLKQSEVVEKFPSVKKNIFKKKTKILW